MVNDKAETDSGSGLYFTETMIKRRPVRICVIFECVGHDTSPTGESPVTGIYRQV